jgi:hypothetical protein
MKAAEDVQPARRRQRLHGLGDGTGEFGAEPARVAIMTAMSHVQQLS